MRKLSLCITTWNRTSLVHEAISKIIDDERISEIVINNDCSEQTALYVGLRCEYVSKGYC